jgi:trans-AT polyketide synthase/acyltransferase/oxidoreductase domain-containing protein
MTLAYVFPGQGSQAKGMGAHLFDRYPDQVALASEVLGYSIRTLCLDDPDERLGQTAWTQPALYVVNALAYQAALEETGRRPDIVAGHSLGEYAALFAAGVLDFEAGLRLVRRRGELMSEVVGGGMAAVVGLSPRRLREAMAEAGLDAIDVANFNSYEQIVVAGMRADIDRAIPVFRQAGARTVVPLNVSAPFHSRHMKPVEDRFAETLAQTRFRPPTIPVLSNVRALPYAGDDAAALLARQITGSVRWIECVEYVFRLGGAEFEEIGPGTVLTGLVSQIRRQSAFAA